MKRCGGGGGKGQKEMILRKKRMLLRSENMRSRGNKEEEETGMGHEGYGRRRTRREKPTKRQQRLSNLDKLEGQPTDPTFAGIYQDGDGEGAGGAERRDLGGGGGDAKLSECLEKSRVKIKKGWE